MAKALNVVEGNTAPQFQITCDRPDGSIINLTNCTVTAFLYLNKVQTNVGHEASSVTILTASEGLIGWQPGVGDFSGKGQFKMNVKVVYSDSTVEVLYNQALFSARNLIQ